MRFYIKFYLKVHQNYQRSNFGFPTLSFKQVFLEPLTLTFGNSYVPSDKLHTILHLKVSKVVKTSLVDKGLVALLQKFILLHEEGLVNSQLSSIVHPLSFNALR